MRSVLAASPLSLGAPVLRFERVERGGSLCDGEPKLRHSNALKPGFGTSSPLAGNFSGVKRFKALPVHRPVDKLGNFIS